MSDLSGRLDLLRSCLEKKRNKEIIPDADLERAGLTSKSRIKDIEKEIVAVRARISSGIKGGIKREEEKELAEEAERQNISVEELKEKLAEQAHDERKKELVKNLNLDMDNAYKAAGFFGAIKKYFALISTHKLFRFSVVSLLQLHNTVTSCASLLFDTSTRFFFYQQERNTKTTRKERRLLCDEQNQTKDSHNSNRITKVSLLLKSNETEAVVYFLDGKCRECSDPCGDAEGQKKSVEALAETLPSGKSINLAVSHSLGKVKDFLCPYVSSARPQSFLDSQLSMNSRTVEPALSSPTDPKELGGYCKEKVVPSEAIDTDNEYVFLEVWFGPLVPWRLIPLSPHFFSHIIAASSPLFSSVTFLALLLIRGWAASRLVELDPSAFDQIIQRRVTTAGTIPLRCLIARRSFCRGEPLARIGAQHILDGGRAYGLLRSCYFNGRPSVFENFLRRLPEIHSDKLSPSALWSRDALLITSLIFLMRREVSAAQPHRNADTHPPLADLKDWIRCWPPALPSFGVELGRSSRDRSAFPPLEVSDAGQTGQARLDSRHRHGAEPVPMTLLENALEMGVHNAVTSGNTQKMKMRPSISLQKNFFEGQGSCLTPRQHAHEAQQPASWQYKQSLQHLVRLDEAVEELLFQLIGALRSDAASDDTLMLNDMAWAHFMLRSRAVNIFSHDAASYQISVLPFVDMLNHSFDAYNVTYRRSQADGSVAVTAARHISAGEELTLHYGNRQQRSITTLGELREDGLQRISPSAALINDMVEDNRTQAEFDTATPAPNGPTRSSLLFRQVTAADEAELANFRSARELNAAAARDCARKSMLEAKAEAEWLWRFGFLKSEEEVLNDASLKWCSGLKSRIARLTDARRRGRPGEFVVGVPEGLQYLREQRQKLERDRYRNTCIFPPQKA
eukprot:gene12047-8299_t